MISALCTLALLPPQTPIALTSKMTISRSATVVPKVYAFASAASDGKDAAIRIVGNNLVVDFKGATLQGTAPTVEPDQRKGTGVYVQGRNITIKNLKIRGYKVGLAAWNSPNIKLENIDASYNWKQRLLSTLDREDGADWMSFHRNENDQWLRFGAAIYLRGCNDFEVKGSRAIGGQCGLMITECNRGRIWNNNFSFLSAIGIGMYKSSENRIMHNNVDWCLRGYSHGKWNRGQDSAGILIYEQSHKNVFAYNSVTHGGDGFFLWAGQTTMDTGQGGCNDNLLYGNDWSHAPTNGIEATFSRNNFVNNLILECWHGIWGGYSYESKVIGNVFGLNAESIAWEHGQDNLVKGNVFHRETMAVNLWANASQDPNWGYPKNRDTRSRDWKIEGNLFSHIVGNTLRVRRTNGLTFTDNRVHNSSVPAIVSSDAASITAPSENEFAVPPGNIFTQNGQAAELGANNRVNQADGRSPMAATMQPSGNVILGLDLQTRAYLERFNLSWNPWLNGGPAPAGAREASVGDELSRPFAPKPLAGGRNPFLKPGTLRGRRFMLVDHWGPYDFKSPLLWPRSAVVDRVQTFEVLGPKGVATVKEELGCAIEAISTDGGASWKAGGGRAARIPVPSHVRVRFTPGATIERKIDLEYVGEAVTDYRGVVTPKGKPFRFGFSQFFAPIDWTVKFFQWNDATDPRTQPDAFKRLIEGTPIKTEKVDRINYSGNVRGVPGDRFATVAEGSFEMPRGEYVLNVTTDDGCRVWVDGVLVIKDAWKYQGPTLYTANLKLGGKHTIRVEHFEIDGHSALSVDLVKK